MRRNLLFVKIRAIRGYKNIRKSGSTLKIKEKLISIVHQESQRIRYFCSTQITNLHWVYTKVSLNKLPFMGWQRFYPECLAFY